MDGNIDPKNTQQFATEDTGAYATEDDVFDLYDEYCHTGMERREFLSRAAALTLVGGVSALGMAQALLPRYANAQMISFTDPRMTANYVTYDSPGGNSGKMRGYLVKPRTSRGARRSRGSSHSRPTGCTRSAAIPAMTTTARSSRPASTATSCRWTC